MTRRIRAFFKIWWKSLLLVALILLLFAFYWRIFAPIPATDTWLDSDDVIIFCGTVLTTPLTQSNGLFFFEMGEKKLVRWEPVRTGSYNCASVAWISQKQQLLFNGTIDSAYGLYFLDKAGNTKKIEAIDLYSSMGHAISSDGKDIAFIQEENLYIESVEGDAQHRLTYNDYINREPDWSPDNQKLVFRTYRQDQDISIIARINRDGTNNRTLTQNRNPLNNPKWSPDGKMIAFKESNGRYRDTLWIMNSDGTNVRQILPPYKDGDTIQNFVWTLDSKHIVFLSSRDEFCIVNVYPRTCTRSLYLIDINTEEITRLTHKWLFHADLARVD